MGASTFWDTATGKTLEEAYDKAVQSALFEYGHDSYNGTISTTRGVIDITRYLKGFQSGGRNKIANAAFGYHMHKEYLPALKLSPAQKKAAQRAFDSHGGRVHKWGACVAWQTGKNKWRFFGWAAE